MNVLQSAGHALSDISSFLWSIVAHLPPMVALLLFLVLALPPWLVWRQRENANAQRRWTKAACITLGVGLSCGVAGLFSQGIFAGGTAFFAFVVAILGLPLWLLPLLVLGLQWMLARWRR